MFADAFPPFSQNGLERSYGFFAHGSVQFDERCGQSVNKLVNRCPRGTTGMMPSSTENKKLSLSLTGRTSASYNRQDGYSGLT